MTIFGRKITKPALFMIIGSTIVVAMALIAVFAPWIAHFNPNAMNLPDQLQPPSHMHWFGTDENGSDVFSKVVYGARVSMGVAWSVVIVSIVVGLVVGSIAGYFGGTTDLIITRIIDIVFAFPGFLLALALVAMLGPSVENLILAMSLSGWAGFARLIRGEVLHLKEKEYVLTAKSMGATWVRQVVVHIWPNLVGLIVVQSTFSMAGTIIAEAGLSFLGLGVPATVPTWGALLSSGRKVLAEAPHVSLFPGLAIVILVLGFNLLGDGLRDQLDPRHRTTNAS